MAEALVVTEAAVKQHLLHLYDKFGIGEIGERRRVRLAREAVRRGAVTLPQLRAAVAGGAAGDDLVRSGRAAFARRDWQSTVELLSEADSREQLAAEDLERLGEAGYWANRHQASYLCQQRAYQAHLQAGDRIRAAIGDSCLMELQAARAAFERLGARPDVASSERRIAELTA